MKVWFFFQYGIIKMCIFNINQSISYNIFHINNYKQKIYITFAITIFIIKMVLKITRIVIYPAWFWFYLVLGISCSQDQNFAWGRGFFHPTWGERPHIIKPNVLINLTYTLIEWEWALQTNFWDWVQGRTFVCVKYT